MTISDTRLLGCMLRIAAIEDPAWRRHFNALADAFEVRHGVKDTRDAERVCGCQLYTALELFEGRPVDGIALDLGCTVRTQNVCACIDGRAGGARVRGGFATRRTSA